MVAKRIKYEKALGVAQEIKRRLVVVFGKREQKGVKKVIVGGLRRKEKTVHDIDILLIIEKNKWEKPEFRLKKGGEQKITEHREKGKRKNVIIVGCCRVDIFLATRAEKPFALFHYTGSKDYNIRTRAQAKKRGWLLNQYGLYDKKNGKKIRGIKTERDITRELGISYRAPTERRAGKE